MIIDDRATLCVYSDVRSVSAITAVLGIEPTDAADIGDLTRSGRAGRPLKPEQLTHQRTFWSLDREVEDQTAEEDTGFSAMADLVSVLVPRVNELAELRKDSETVIRWSGHSDSSQGGFVLTAELIRQLAILGCDVYGTAYLEDPTELEQ